MTVISLDCNRQGQKQQGLMEVSLSDTHSHFTLNEKRQGFVQKLSVFLQGTVCALERKAF